MLIHGSRINKKAAPFWLNGTPLNQIENYDTRTKKVKFKPAPNRKPTEGKGANPKPFCELCAEAGNICT
jgi:hypothetical protein